jgi:hypothetical protein
MTYILSSPQSEWAHTLTGHDLSAIIMSLDHTAMLFRERNLPDRAEPLKDLSHRLTEARLGIEPERHQTVGISAIAFGPLK